MGGAQPALAATAPPRLLLANPVEVLPGAFSRVPADALPARTGRTAALASLSGGGVSTWHARLS